MCVPVERSPHISHEEGKMQDSANDAIIPIKIQKLDYAGYHWNDPQELETVV